ncbi:MAG TPA: SpoIIE family protein phosphatase [Actinomycetota bacterium]|nr:SpoIIE family protein phosphatase [Actinomycetota bacterium]
MSSETEAPESIDHRSPGPSVLARLVLAMVVAGLVTGVVGSWLIANSAGKALRSQIDRQNEAQALSLAKRLDDRIVTRANTLQVVATRTNIAGLGESTGNELNVVLKPLPEIDRLTVFDANGLPVASASNRSLVDLQKLGVRTGVLEGLTPGAHRTSLLGTNPPTVELSVPIQNPPGTVVAALVAEIPLEELASHLEEVQSGGAHTAFLVDGDGTLLVHPDRDRVLEGERFDIPEDQAASGGSFTGRGFDSGRYLFAADRSSQIPASVVVQQPEAEALSSVSTSTRNLALILFAVMLVTVATVSVVGRFLLAPLRAMAGAARRIGRGEHGARVPVGGYGEVGRLGAELNRMADALEQRIAELEERKAAEVALREQSKLAETLYNVGSVLTAQLDLKEVVQAVTNIATDLTGAQFGAFFYNVVDREGESYMLYTLAGVPPEAFSGFPMPRNTDIFGPTFRGEGTVRHDDVTQNPNYGQNEPYFGMPDGHLPVRSYLASPVVSKRGEVLGGLFFGHEEVGVFTEGHAKLAEGIAGQAAIAIDNARLYAAQRSAAETLQRSILPARLPQLPGLETAARYRPAEVGIEVGGDWYDILELDSGAVAVVVGDVVGRGLAAAGIMGQLCHAVRAYALEDPSPGAVLSRLNRFIEKTGEEPFATVVFAVFDPKAGTFRVANAGHPPALMMHTDGTAEFLEQNSGPPIGAVTDNEYTEEVVTLTPGCRLLLYTDGLVEDRRTALSAGLEKLRQAAMKGPDDIEEFCDYVLDRMAVGRDLQDDIAVLAIGAVPLE